MSAVCGILFEALFPGSSHPTRFTVLTLLGIIMEIFPISEGKMSYWAIGKDFITVLFQIIL